MTSPKLANDSDRQRKRMSFSRWMTYRKCPQLYYIDSILKLPQQPSWGESQDPRDVGSTLHKSLELLLQQSSKYRPEFLYLKEEVTEEKFSVVRSSPSAANESSRPSSDSKPDLSSLRALSSLSSLASCGTDPQELVKNAIQERGVFFAHDLLKEESLKDWSEVLGKFIERVLVSDDKSNPKAVTVALEKKFHFEYRGWQWSGVMDRIDRYGPTGSYRLVDYKSKYNSSFQPKFWIEKGEFQMLFYGWVFQEILKADAPAEALEYWTLRDTKVAGFRLAPWEAAGDTPTRTQDSSVFSRDWISTSTEIFLTELNRDLDSIEAQDFAPRPREDVDCEGCPGRGLCRQPRWKT